MEMNPVIYNPNVVCGDDAKTTLHDAIKEYVGYELSSNQLNELTSYDSNHLDEFVISLRKMINL